MYTRAVYMLYNVYILYICISFTAKYFQMNASSVLLPRACYKVIKFI